MKLLLTSFWTSPEQDRELSKLVGKTAQDTKVAYIENAHDIYDDEDSLIEGRNVLKEKGFDFELVDLRNFKGKYEELRKKLESKDVFLLTGGNPFYLRWLMKEVGADEIIIDLVGKGKVYVGASAAGVVAGPTLKYFDNQDDPNAAKEIIWEGLGLTQTVVVPHIDNEQFGAGCREAGERLKEEGFTIQPIKDDEAFLIDGDHQAVI
jgi:dipeptidase E